MLKFQSALQIQPMCVVLLTSQRLRRLSKQVSGRTLDPWGHVRLAVRVQWGFRGQRFLLNEMGLYWGGEWSYSKKGILIAHLLESQPKSDCQAPSVMLLMPRSIQSLEVAPTQRLGFFFVFSLFCFCIWLTPRWFYWEVSNKNHS